MVKVAIDTVGIGADLAVVGWALDPTGPLRSLSLAVGDHWVAAEMGMERPDVAAAFPSLGHAGAAGFLARGLLPPPKGGMVVLTAVTADGSNRIIPLGRIEDGAFLPAEPAKNAAIVAMRRRPGLDFSFMEAILRVCAPAPRPIPCLSEPALVIVPVYGALPLLPEFFRSLFATLPPGCRVVVVDDGNADPALIELLERHVREQSAATLVRLPANRGYVEAIWAGFAHWLGEHVVVVNTDTVLPPYWLERLLAPLADPRVASTTPFSNAGSICGFPDMPADNPLWRGLAVDDIDRALRRLDPSAIRLDLPTGVGFCMAMSRHALGRIGFIERDTFGKGYGEENDWCRRAVSQGMVHLVVPNLYVYHRHGGSFSSAEKQALIARNLALLARRYPDYHAEVGELVLADPLRPLRRFMAFLLAAERHGTVLITSDAAFPSERPAIVLNDFGTGLSWNYEFRLPEWTLRLRGGNIAELRTLAEVMPVETRNFPSAIDFR